MGDSHTPPDKSRRACWNADGTSKRGFTKKVAKKKAAQMAGPNWRSKGLQVYPCHECGWFHVGRNSFHGKSREATR